MNDRQAWFFVVYLCLALLFVLFSKYSYCRLVRVRRVRSRAFKVVNLGLSRTGTSSFSEAMQSLGFQCWHFSRKRPQSLWRQGYNCVSDLPFYRTKFTKADLEPNTVYFLTVRRPQDWLRSMKIFLWSMWKLDVEQPFEFRWWNGCSLDFRDGSPLTCLQYLVHDVRKEYLDMLLSDRPDYFIVSHMLQVLRVFKNARVPLYIVDVTCGSDEYKWSQLTRPLRTLGLDVRSDGPFPHVDHATVYRRQLGRLF